jgi:hypothetical protein
LPIRPNFSEARAQKIAMEDAGHPRLAGAPAVIVARAMSESANKTFAGMEQLLGAQRIGDIDAPGIRLPRSLPKAAISVPWQLARPHRLAMG